MKLKPLQQFICDKCRELIKSPTDGWLEWLHSNDDRTTHGFRVVHNGQASPGKQDGKRCQYHTDLLVGDMHLDHFLGSDGLAALLSMIDRPFDNQQEFVEIIRRLHIPYYEEARLYWQKAKQDDFFSGANEYWPYLEANLTRLIETYENPEEHA